MDQKKPPLDKVIADRFFKAVNENDFKTFKKYLITYPELIDYRKNGRTPLQIQIYDCEFIPKHISYLLKKGACTNVEGVSSARSLFLLEELFIWSCSFAEGDTITRILISSGNVCSIKCGHTDNDLKRDLVDQAFDCVLGAKCWGPCMFLVLHASRSKEEYLDRYTKVNNKCEFMDPNMMVKVELPERKFLSVLFFEQPLSLDQFHYGMICPFAAHAFEKLLATLDLETLEKTLKQEYVEQALITRNKQGLQALVRKLPFIVSDQCTQNILVMFHAALENHKKIWKPFAKEIALIEKTEKNRQELLNICSFSKIKNIYFKFA